MYTKPFVSIIVPMLNEAQYIERCIKSLLGQDFGRENFEIIVVDGGSTDGSIGIVTRFANQHPNVKLYEEPGTNTPAAMNVGIRNARGQIICKVDAHGYVAHDFIRQSVQFLASDKTIWCVGGPIHQQGDSFVAQAVGFARSSWFGVGSGAYTVGEKQKYVDSVQCGTYRREVFVQLGLFDESLAYGEDEEINWRIIKAGYKILSTPDIIFYYYPRDSIRKLFRQYVNYGSARVRVVLKHPDFLKLKHLIPPGFVMYLFTGILASLVHFPLALPFLSVIAIYTALSLACSLKISRRAGLCFLPVMPLMFFTIHVGYGLGFLKSVLAIILAKLGKFVLPG